MNQHNSIDLLLEKALSSTHAPDEELNQITKKRMKEKMALKKTGIKPTFRLALTTVVLVLIVSGTAYAIWNYLSADEYADQRGYPALAEAFKSEGAIQINKSVTSGEYKITLLGVVSGKGLMPMEEDIKAERSYAVVAIEKPDGQMPDTSDEDYDEVPFFVSPLIKGQIPWQVNICTMNGAYTGSTIDGIIYRLIDCDSINMFADRGVYLAVSSSAFYDINAFEYNFESGKITPKADYNGVNVIFDLPLDKTKADPEKAQRLLDEIYGGNYEEEVKKTKEAAQNNEQDNVIIDDTIHIIPDEEK